MRTLLQTLQDRDRGFLRVVAELWGLEMPSGSSDEIAQTLAEHMTDPEQLEDLLASLPDQAAELLDQLAREGGRTPFARIDRTYGPFREMGPGRRDREQPWRQPASALEIVWYRGLLGRAFADSPLGPQEFIYLPSDLALLLRKDHEHRSVTPGNQTQTPARVERADTSAVDDATTILAAFRKRPPERVPLRRERRAQLSEFLYQSVSVDLIVDLLLDLRLLEGKSYEPAPDYVGPFLEASRSQALKMLIAAWRDTERWNDLAALPHLRFAAANWPNDAGISRRAALELFQPIPTGEWWDLATFLADVKRYHPAFQRPGGDFESWYLQDASGAFLNGIEHWDSVDGAYLRFVIEGPLHWLGITDLGRSDQGAPINCFRLTPASKLLLNPESRLHVEDPDSKITVKSNGEVIVPRGADRVTRYQIARISAWDPPDRLGHHFRLTPGALQIAKEQGLNARHILQLLENAVESGLPPSVVRAVERWSRTGIEARLAHTLLLRVEEPAILETLVEHVSTKRHIAEILTPTTAIIAEADWPSLRDAAARLGLLLEPPES